MIIRRGSVDDAGSVLAVLDAAVAWLVAHGNTGQWGSTPFSTRERYPEIVRGWAAEDGFHVATADDRVVAALLVGDEAPAYAPAVSEPEVYVRWLVTDHSPAARGAGSRLLDEARSVARARGVSLLRVDCYAGNGGALVGYYEKQGFTRDTTFTVDRPDGPWPGQVLSQRVPAR